MDTAILLALAIGGAFGVALDRVGATNPNLIVGMLSLRGLHLMKTILFAIGVGSVLMFGGQMLGLVEVGHMSVKAAYSGVFIGGLLLGAGWAATGYCPGTGLAAAASGRRDAVFFALGGLLGAAAYMLSYSWVKTTGALEEIAGGKATLGAVPGAGYPALVPGAPGDMIGLALGAAFILIAFALPDRLRRSDVAVPAE
ncbi:MAG: YeeE/YedE family protein [Rhodobacteraceae bacterium]|nr:YeeE/YedE family protein [Paracoccaceae bacterium]